MNEKSVIDKLYIEGIISFNNKEFYDAHEYWEELWSDYKVENPKFIQALIQLAVGFFHITNFNRNGALGLFRKSKEKFVNFPNYYRKQNVLEIIRCIDDTVEQINQIPDKKNLNKFNWENIIELNEEY
tara:strand:- start:283 stop:666 length:384 start_codon:yes stop_codon:yes gene_type:complete